MSVPKHIVALINAKNEEILRLEREKAESEHALGFAVDAVERLEAEKSEMLEALERLVEAAGPQMVEPDLALEFARTVIRKARGEA